MKLPPKPVSNVPIAEPRPQRRSNSKLPVWEDIAFHTKLLHHDLKEPVCPFGPVGLVTLRPWGTPGWPPKFLSVPPEQRAACMAKLDELMLRYPDRIARDPKHQKGLMVATAINLVTKPKAKHWMVRERMRSYWWKRHQRDWAALRAEVDRDGFDTVLQRRMRASKERPRRGKKASPPIPQERSFQLPLD